MRTMTPEAAAEYRAQFTRLADMRANPDERQATNDAWRLHMTGYNRAFMSTAYWQYKANDTPDAYVTTKLYRLSNVEMFRKMQAIHVRSMIDLFRAVQFL